MAKLKTFTYHKSHSFVDVKTGQKITFATQLYQVGVYGIMNNNSSMQGNYEPKDIVKAEKNFVKLQEQGIIKDLVFGTSITVAQIDGFWKKE
jgi:flagellar basal body rod protein FlgC